MATENAIAVNLLGSKPLQTVFIICLSFKVSQYIIKKLVENPKNFIQSYTTINMYQFISLHKNRNGYFLSKTAANSAGPDQTIKKTLWDRCFFWLYQAVTKDSYIPFLKKLMEEKIDKMSRP